MIHTMDNASLHDAPVSDYVDCVQRCLTADQAPKLAANSMLAHVLQGCVLAHPWPVAAAMQMRNFLVRPWRLRTSNIGCPVSSLLDPKATLRFAGYPVRQILQDEVRRAEVILGADDRHLSFRTLIAVECLNEGAMQVSMTTQVKTRNRFGWLYMCVVDPLHRRWIAPAILDAALNHACSAVAGSISPSSATDTRQFAAR